VLSGLGGMPSISVHEAIDNLLVVIPRACLCKRTRFANVTQPLEFAFAEATAEAMRKKFSFHDPNSLKPKTLRAASESPRHLVTLVANFYNPPPDFRAHSFA
jgi:hypothetical protein